MSSPPNDLGDTTYKPMWNDAHWIDSDELESRNKTCRVYVDGVYDLFHYGHAEMLGRVRAHFGPSAVIIAGIARDDDCIKYKRRPILTQSERARSLRTCKYVDEVIDDAPWVITQEFLETHAIDYVCHDEASYPSADGTVGDIYEYVKSIGKFVAIERTPSISTSEIIERIRSRH
jgi:choline-phosphate cytidylyltransferase